ncbi:glycine zipper 2TM domain-containing protein [Natrialbaceae archaeon A-CW2]|uniref:glycine zipper 2TM domain-containing protein n=1 Tax=Natronosalvus amylolyticus TaxID=2961994 RepID=UPI0020CA0746|nr:glycine zipper 2TM domain-containing protein [Natronosalvus amylolyticus]
MVKQRINRMLSRARYAAIGAAIGGFLGGLFNKNLASSGAAVGALAGAVIGERRPDAEQRFGELKNRGEENIKGLRSGSESAE